MATRPTRVEVRSYQVGFGDCFLVSFVYSAKDRRHVLIDFGTTELPARGGKRAKASEHMTRIARQIAQDCGGQLTAVVATHRHADHISGFGLEEGKTGKSGAIIRGLSPRLVLQPWTEDPKAAKNATHATADSARSTKSFVAGLTAMHAVAGAVVDLTRRPPAWMGASLAKELRFLGMDNLANRSAVDNLIAMGAAKGAKAVYARYGSNAGFGRLLPGVKVHVLGPPSLVQSERIRKQRARDPDEFWHLLAGRPGALRERALLATGLPERAHVGEGGRPRVPPEARWFRDRLNRLRGQQLLEIVRTLDDQMNNTSLILLFEVGGRKLLFPGDAQIENWSYALEEAREAKANRRLVADADFYKVGHHGSLNATPKKLLWENFAKRGHAHGKRLKAMLSTLPGKHGKAASDTEVPRRPLLTALRNDTDLTDTHSPSVAVETAPVIIEIDEG